MEGENPNNAIVSRDGLNNVASWVSATVISAFFASLERCSCVNLTTTDPDDDDEEEAKDRPLTLTANSHQGGGDDAVKGEPDSWHGFCSCGRSTVLVLG